MLGVTEQEVDWWVNRNLNLSTARRAWRNRRNWMTAFESCENHSHRPAASCPDCKKKQLKVRRADYCIDLKGFKSFVARLKKVVRTPLRLLPKHLPVLADLLSPIETLEGYPELKAFLQALKKARIRQRKQMDKPVALLERPKLGHDAPMGNVGIYWAAYLHMRHFGTNLLNHPTKPQLQAINHLIKQLDEVVNSTKLTATGDERGGGMGRRLSQQQTMTQWKKYNRPLRNPKVFDIHLAEHGSGKTSWCSKKEKTAFKNEFTGEKSEEILTRALKPKKGKLVERSEMLRDHWAEAHFNPPFKAESTNFFNNFELATVTTVLNCGLYPRVTSKTTSGVRGRRR